MKKSLIATLLAATTLIAPAAEAGVSTVNYVYAQNQPSGSPSVVIVVFADGSEVETDSTDAMFNHFLMLATTAFEQHNTVSYGTGSAGVFGYPKIWYFELSPSN